MESRDGKIVSLVDKQIPCPVCGNLFVAEFYEPRGSALCLQCGTTFRRLRDRLVTLGEMKPDEITPDTSFVDNFKMDSLDVFELVMALEEEGIELSDAEAGEIKTVKDAIRVINQRRGAWR
jgi:acyl carrier protein